MGSANDRRRCILTSSLIDRAHSQNDPYCLVVNTNCVNSGGLKLRYVLTSNDIAYIVKFYTLVCIDRELIDISNLDCAKLPIVRG